MLGQRRNVSAHAAVFQCGVLHVLSINVSHPLLSKQAQKKAGRATTEGLATLAVREDRRRAAIIELSCETDFVARTEQFQGLAKVGARQQHAINRMKRFGP
eukprot:SAG31_NODE_5513_length_2485_cov_2.063286_2_plen_101_part_00